MAIKLEVSQKCKEGHKMRKRVVIIFAAVLILGGIAAGIYYTFYYNLFPKKAYTAADFDIETIKSSVDYNNNGIDDYTDIVNGARESVYVSYRSAYYQGGYPPDNEGVCTDVIWRAFKNAGYSLKDMVDEDIAANISAYPRVNGSADPNIDFRRVANLKVFFERHATSLTLDPSDISKWQPGDIVTYDCSHIAIVSDKRDSTGQVYIIHNEGQPVRDEDALTRHNIDGHFRFEYKK